MVYVALLRGINVGGNRAVSMAALKRAFESAGMTHVTTYIASGNVIFSVRATDTAKLAKKLEASLDRAFGLDIRLLIRDLKEMTNLVSSIPKTWVNDKDTKCDVMFLWDEIDSHAILKQLPWNKDIEEIQYVKGAVLWRIDRTHATRSRMTKIVGTPIYKQMTIRNPNTVRKILDLMLSEHPPD
jgi:uncharacterized protein (DUF1697 family)